MLNVGMKSRKAWLAALTGASLVLGLASIPAISDIVLPEDFIGRETNEGVFVRDSAVAQERLALGQRMERLREWDKSADVFQEILEKYPDRVVPTGTDPGGKVYQYSSVALAVQERLARWPEEGLQVYRRRFEPVAQALLDQAGRDDYSTLHQVLSLYFVTEPGKQAGIRLMDLYLESGEFPAAAWLGDQLISMHPGLAGERPMVLYRTALAYHLASDATKSAERLATLKANHADAVGMVRGKEVRLADTLEADLKSPTPVTYGNAADSWPVFMGSPDRGRISSAAGRPDAQAVRSIPFARPSWKGNDANVFRQIEEDRANPNAEQGISLGVIPVVDRGELFFQDNARIYGISLESGLPLSGWSQTYTGELNGQYATNGWPTPRGLQLTVTVSDDSVLAVMGQPDRAALMQGGQLQQVAREGQLVCLDRATGKQRWVVSPSQLPDSTGALRSVTLGGSPLVVGDNVYVTGRGGKGMQFEDCYVLCYNLYTGEYRWSCYIASASSGQAMMMGGETGFPSEIPAHLAYTSGRLYVQTNLGAVASVDAYRGSIVWVSLYPRDVSSDQNTRFQRFQGGQPTGFEQPWTFNPPIVQDGRLFALPHDGKHVLIYNAGNGTELNRINLADLNSGDTLLGVAGDKLVVASDKRVICLYWQQYSADTFSARGPAVAWASAGFPKQIRGRGFMTRDAVYVPTSDALVRIEMRNGKVGALPRNGAWLDGTSPAGTTSAQGKTDGAGNLLVTQEHVVVAGLRRVDVYTDLALARARLEREVAASPDAPEPRLRYAEVMFVAGEHDVAITKLDEAIQLIGGMNSMRPGSARDRIFSDAMTFAQALQTQPNRDAPANDRINQLYDRAAASATNPSQQVTWRISRAKFAGTLKDAFAEVRLYQDILLDPEMRNVSLADDSPGGSSRAGAVAEQAIARVIASNPSAYTQFDGAARTAFDTYRLANDPIQLLSVAEMYPNSKVAPDAMLAAADAFETRKEHRRATLVLRQIYFRYPDGPQTPRVIEALARNYLLMPNRIDVAISRLALGARLPGDPRLENPLPLPDGRVLRDVTFGEALTEVRNYRRNLPPLPLPNVKLPVDSVRDGDLVDAFRPENPANTLAGISGLVIPPVDFSRHDRVIAWSRDRGILVYPIAKSEPLLTNKVLDAQPTGAAWIGSDLLVWSDQRIALLGEQGTLWQLDVKSLSDVQRVDDAGGKDETLTLAPEGGDVLIEGGIGQRGMNRRRGNVPVVPRANLSQTPMVPPNAPEMVMNVNPTGDRIILSTSTGRVVAADIQTGQVVWQSRLIDNRPLDRLVANDDFTVARVADNNAVRLVALDTFSGQIVNSWNFPLSANPPMNLTLATDGTLVVTLADRLFAKDLHEPGSKPKWENQAQSGQGVFYGAIQPDHLQISDGRIVAVSDQGRLIRLYSLETGAALHAEAVGPNRTGPLGTGYEPTENDPTFSRLRLRQVGSMLYVMGPMSLQAYNLDQPAQRWTGSVDVSARLIDLVVDQQFVITFSDQFDQANNPPAGPRAAISFLAFARKRGDTESGLLTYDSPPLNNPAGILSWQAVNGGLYYLTGDQKLHFLQGSDE